MNSFTSVDILIEFRWQIEIQNEIFYSISGRGIPTHWFIHENPRETIRFQFSFLNIFLAADGPNDCRRRDGNVVLYFRRFAASHDSMSLDHRGDAMDGNAISLAIDHRSHWHARFRWVPFFHAFHEFLEMYFSFSLNSHVLLLRKIRDFEQ